MNIQPVTCWRPVPGHAAAWVDGRVGALSPDDAARRLRDGAARAMLLRDENAALYAWRADGGSTAFTGIVAGVATSDLDDGAVSLPAVADAAAALQLELIAAARAQLVPAAVAYEHEPAIDVLVGLAATGEPLYDLACDGVRHRVWRIVRPAAVESLCVVLERMPGTVVAAPDVAAALRLLRARRRLEGTAVGGADVTLCLLHAATQGAVPAFPSALLLHRV